MSSPSPTPGLDFKQCQKTRHETPALLLKFGESTQYATVGSAVFPAAAAVRNPRAAGIRTSESRMTGPEHSSDTL
jgi:hypothetical protein